MHFSVGVFIVILFVNNITSTEEELWSYDDVNYTDDSNILNAASFANQCIKLNKEEEKLVDVAYYKGSIQDKECFKVVMGKIRKTAEEGNLDDAMLEYILTSTKPESIKLVIYEDKLRRYFPKSYTKEQIEDTVMKLIQKWHKNREKENER